MNEVSFMPDSIELSPGRLQLMWPDGAIFLSAAALRAACRCADCRAAALSSHAVTVDPAMTLTNVEPVGHYALRLTFSDGHGRGIYPWPLLRELSMPIGRAGIRPLPPAPAAGARPPGGAGNPPCAAPVRHGD